MSYYNPTDDIVCTNAEIAAMGLPVGRPDVCLKFGWELLEDLVPTHDPQYQSVLPQKPEKSTDGRWILHYVVTDKSPDKIAAERAVLESNFFARLREIRDARLIDTDKYLLPDYPVSAEALAQIMCYRAALRDLPEQPGAPWPDGNIPWPTQPEI